MQLWVHNLIVAGGGNIASANPSLAGYIKPHLAGALGNGVDPDAFHAEQEVHNLLLHAWDDGVFMRHTVNLDPGDGRALNRA